MIFDRNSIDARYVISGCSSLILGASLLTFCDSATEVELELTGSPEPTITGLAHQFGSSRGAQPFAECGLRRGKLIRVR
jgi:hypothetical protein